MPRILLLTHSFNSLAQRLFIELRERGHDVTVEFDINDAVTREAAELARPDVVIAPFLKRRIPPEVYERHVCLVVHPGPPGDRGPSALDWAILEGRSEWGVTVLQAGAELDGGPVWESERFPLRAATKSSLYRNEVTEAATRAVRRCMERFPDPGRAAPVPGALRPAARQADRAIDWARHGTDEVLRRIRSADGTPGLRDDIGGRPVLLFDAHPAPGLSGRPGALLGRRGGAVARATADGAVFIGHLAARDDDPALKLPALKLPATAVLGAAADDLPEVDGDDDIRYEERGGVGYLHFPFRSGALSTDQCVRLLEAYRAARRRPARVLALMGGPDAWCNGIHLGVIEAAPSPADESWRTINAIDDLAREIITTDDRLTVAALQGNAGAGGVFLALAADVVWARRGIVLNPHYKGMGNLYGSEYWTYLLPRRAGEEAARAVTEARLPMGTPEAMRLRLIDDAFGDDVPGFRTELDARLAALAADPGLPARLAGKARRRAEDEARKPLEAYRAEELERMKLNFYGFDPSYHVARFNFVFKVPKSRTPPAIAFHRR